MRKNIKTTEAIFPMPVLMVATYNDDGSVNVMNAAWGTMVGYCSTEPDRNTPHRSKHQEKKKLYCKYCRQ